MVHDKTLKNKMSYIKTCMILKDLKEKKVIIKQGVYYSDNPSHRYAQNFQK
jgi:hypothetical protein